MNGVSRGTSPRAPVRTAPLWTAEQWHQALTPVIEAVLPALDDVQRHRLAAYMALLQQWNTTYNLTALRDPQEMLSHHLADCLAVIAPMLGRLGVSFAEAQDTPPRLTLLDVGSGGGLPGVVLAIACPAIGVTCVDTVGKKAAFIRQVAAQLGLPNLRAEHARVEQLKGQFHVVASRAFASLPDFTAWTAHLLAPGAWWMAMKGRHPDEELAALPPSVRVVAEEPVQVPGLEAERCLLWMQPAA